MKPELVLPIGHTQDIISASFSPDNMLIVTADDDNIAKIWEVSSGKMLHSFEDVEGAIFSPGGKFIALITINATLKIWDIQNGLIIQSMEGHTSPIHVASFSPDGNLIITGSSDNTVKLWDVHNGILIHSMEGHHGAITSAVFNPDGKLIITGSRDSTARIWDAEAGKVIHILEGHNDIISSVSFSRDGLLAGTSSWDKTAKIWNVLSGNMIQSLEGHNKIVESITFSPDGKWVITSSGDPAIKIWDLRTGFNIYSFRGCKTAHISPDGKSIVTADWDETSKIWEIESGELIQTLKGHAWIVNSAEFNSDGNLVVTSSCDNTAKIWDVKTGKTIHTLKGHTSSLVSSSFSADGKMISATSYDNTAIIRDVQTGKIFHSLMGHRNVVESSSFSPDGHLIVTGSRDKAAKIWDIITGKMICTLDSHTAWLNSTIFSPDGKLIATTSEDNTAKIWDVKSGEMLHSLEGHTRNVETASFDLNSKLIVTESWDRTIKIWDTQTGQLLHTLDGRAASFHPESKELITASWENTAAIWEIGSWELKHTLNGHSDLVTATAYSPDGHWVVTGSEDKSIKIWDSQTGKLKQSLMGISSSSDGKSQTPGCICRIEFISFSPDSKFIVAVETRYSSNKIPDDSSIQVWDLQSGALINSINTKQKFNSINIQNNLLITHDRSIQTLWDIKEGKELFSFVAIDSADWIIIHPSGLFDASSGAMEKMYFVKGLEVIEFEQLKSRYYEPGLWAKVMGFNKEPLRQSRGLDKIDLYPGIDLIPPSDNKGKLGIHLINRGGGIGKVKIWINGKEVTGDARKPGTNPDATKLEIGYEVQGHPYIKPGEVNMIEVKAYNGEEYLLSRGAKITYVPDGKTEETEPELYGIVIGTSDYQGEKMDLRYAAKDGFDFAAALELTGSHYFHPDKVKIELLTTDNPDRSRWPTKENIKKTFEKIGTMANAGDVLVVYMSGHGINYGGAEGDFYYLTCDAASGDLKDPAIRENVSISSGEFTEYIKIVPALKQVLVIDACHSGQLAEDLMTARAMRSSSEIRALERMKDRTGTYILAGSAADAVSYEASMYGQGLLTYSLLFGMKGAALRENRFVDVMQLFQFAADEVPRIAKNIGGIQKPEVRVPYGGQSFDIGISDEEVRNRIKLPSPKPVFVRSVFMNEYTFSDDLGLAEALDEKLKEYSSGEEMDQRLIFIDALRFEDGYSVKGMYRYTDQHYLISIKIYKDTNVVKEIKVQGELKEEITNNILEVIKELLQIE